MALSTSIFKFYIREMSEVRIKTDNGIVFNSEEETKNYKFSQKREEVDMRKEHANVPGTFSQMNFIANGNTQIYERKIKKFFEIIVTIGGFANGIIYSAYVILFLYSKNMIVWNCIEANFSQNEINQNVLFIKKEKVQNEVINSRLFNNSEMQENEPERHVTNVPIRKKNNENLK